MSTRALALALTAAALTLTGCHTHPSTAAPATTPSAIAPSTDPRPADAPADGEARALLDTLPVRVEDTGAHYRRADWGDWAHPAHGGCDTRARILIRDAQPDTMRRGAGCRITAGTWTSSYDGVRVTDPTGVQIDHRVPLREAARSGARGWSATRRAHFYNDTTNLIAVSARSNEGKGDSDPGRWRPPNHAAWCAYATAYITTKYTYGLTVDPAERAALAAMLATCPAGQR
jgi:hypothetical protein